MYQFVVGATTPEVTRMAMTSGTNKWASRAVVILQLATWSAVGIVLLQKGVTSLQKGPEARNATQIASTNPVAFQANTEENGLSVVPLVEESLRASEKSRWAEELPSDFRRQPKGLQFPLDPEDEPRVLESAERSREAQLSDLLTKTVRKRTKFDDVGREFESLQLPRNHSRNSILMNLKDEREIQRLLEKTDGDIAASENATERISQKPHSEVTTPAPPPPPTKPESVWESRRRLRLSHLSGGGAAAAVAMVAVGAVMLVLGPAVIVLRALDERRQERRFLKLSGRDDLPPTYEQATLMDEAPRYSSLSLNTILGPPPPPSPTSTRAQLV